MAALTDLQLMAVESPALGTPPLSINGVSFTTLSDLFQALLDSNSSIVELALAQLFRILANEDRNSSLTLGEFSFTRRTGMSFDDRRQYWEQKYRAKYLFSGAVPTIAVGYSPLVR